MSPFLINASTFLYFKTAMACCGGPIAKLRKKAAGGGACCSACASHGKRKVRKMRGSRADPMRVYRQGMMYTM